MKKYKIGYTTGVFDLFHIGHLNIIKLSKKQCEYLIVGVSTDELAISYKGKKPIIPFDERIQIIRAIRYVDEVVVQDTMDKMVAWEKYRFNALFHGDDWRGSKLYEEIEQKFERVGVDVVYFPYTQGTSSTIIKNHLYNIT